MPRPRKRYRRKRAKSSNKMTYADVKNYILHRAELKWTLSSGLRTGFTVDRLGWIFEPFANPANGTTDTTRIGDKIEPYRFYLDGYIEADIFNAVSKNFLRVILFQHKTGGFTNGASTDVNKVLNGTEINTICAPFASYVKDHMREYTVLFDKTYKVCLGFPATGPLAVPSNFVVPIKIRIGAKKMKQIRYAGGGFVPTSGRIQMLLISDGLATEGPRIYANLRMDYKDL